MNRASRTFRIPRGPVSLASYKESERVWYKVLEEIIAENFTNLVKDTMYMQIREAQRT